MDTELFMECEEEELEPWQQVDDGVDEDNDNVGACEPASLSPSSLKSMAPPLPSSCAAAPVLLHRPFFLTQTSGGAHLLLSAQALPLPSPGPSRIVNLLQKPSPGVQLALGASSSLPAGHTLLGPPPQLGHHASRGHQASGDPAAPSSSSSSSMMPTKVVLSVDEFYYGMIGGEQPLRKKYRQALDTFDCSVCQRAFSDNLRLVQHTLQHSPLVRGGDDRKMCAFCFRQFSSGAHLQGHRERVHGPAPSSCTCRICEWAFDDEPAFLNHMKTNHKPGEMPYVCQVCFYRSSFYSDVLQHFASFHRNSRYLLCIFCLKVSRNVASYQKHVLHHQAGQAFHCSRCRLQFAFLADKKRHKLERHRSVRRPAKLEGLPLGSKVTIRMYGKKRIPAASVGGGAQLLRDPSCLIQPIKIKTEQQSASGLGDSPLANPPPSPFGRPHVGRTATATLMPRRHIPRSPRQKQPTFALTIIGMSRFRRGPRQIHPSIHLSIFFCLSGVGSRGQQLQERLPDFPLPSHFIQLIPGDPKAFPGQLIDIVSPVRPGSSPGSPSGGTCPEHLPREASRRHPDEMYPGSRSFGHDP